MKKRTQKQIDVYNFNYFVNNIYEEIFYLDKSFSFSELKHHFYGNREYTIKIWNSLLNIQIPYNPPHKAIKQIIGNNGQITLIRNDNYNGA